MAEPTNATEAALVPRDDATLRPAGVHETSAPGLDRRSWTVRPTEADAPSELAGAELTLIVPTLNERENIQPLLDRLEHALDGERWEVVFVDDDSTDGTPELIRAIARTDRRVRCLQRIGRRGLSTACIEGVLASAAEFVAVMDADLQHDERLLPEMLRTLRAETLDVVVGSRYVAGGSLGDWDAGRARISGLATRLSRLVLKAELKDPMSGFFMMRRGAFEAALRRLSGQGFKILLDLFASSPSTLRFKELPFRFGVRLHGASKLDSMVAWEYLMLIADKLVGGAVPVRFLLFAAIGGLGLVVHLATLALCLKVLGLGFGWAQGLATLTAMVGNYALNNQLTYRDRRLTGWRFVQGLVSFAAICSVGALANVGIATFIYNADRSWALAGVAGALVGSVWNYAVTSVFTWRPKRAPA